MKKEDVVNYIIKFFWIFIIGSFLGYIVETIVALVQEGQFASRKGLIYGPFIQIYGIGMLIYYLTISKIKDNRKVFIVSMIVGGIVEYLCSYIQEKWFGTVSWDYSNLMLNINGRTSLLHCLYWGTGGVLFIKFVCPLIEKIDEYSKNYKFKCVTNLLVIFMVFNITISCLAAVRQEERMKNIEPNGSLDIMLDKYYPDHVMNKIYSNKINRISNSEKSKI